MLFYPERLRWLKLSVSLYQSTSEARRWSRQVITHSFLFPRQYFTKYNNAVSPIIPKSIHLPFPLSPFLSPSSFSLSPQPATTNSSNNGKNAASNVRTKSAVLPTPIPTPGTVTAFTSVFAFKMSMRIWRTSIAFVALAIREVGS